MALERTVRTNDVDVLPYLLSLWWSALPYYGLCTSFRLEPCLKLMESLAFQVQANANAVERSGAR
jgi:hypothetical protein